MQEEQTNKEHDDASREGIRLELSMLSEHLQQYYLK